MIGDMHAGISKPDFPRIERFFPNCILGVVEAIQCYRSGNRSLSGVYCNHSFIYAPGSFRLPDGSPSLDINFSSFEIPFPELKARLKSLHDIDLVTTRFSSDEGYLEELDLHAARGEPIVVQFDFFFLKGRREYRKIHHPHWICIYGHADGKGDFLACEQVLGHVRIPRSDLGDFIRFITATEAARIIAVSGGGRTDAQLIRSRILEDLRRDIEGIRSKDATVGLTGLANFIKDIGAWAENEGRRLHRPFYIPGLWRISHDRHELARQLAVLDGDPEGPDGDSPISKARKSLNVLFKGWWAVDLLIEKGLLRNRFEDSVSAVRRLAGLREKEESCAADLERLLDFF